MVQNRVVEPASVASFVAVTTHGSPGQRNRSVSWPGDTQSTRHPPKSFSSYSGLSVSERGCGVSKTWDFLEKPPNKPILDQLSRGGGCWGGRTNIEKWPMFWGKLYGLEEHETLNDSRNATPIPTCECRRSDSSRGLFWGGFCEGCSRDRAYGSRLLCRRAGLWI